MDTAGFLINILVFIVLVGVIVLSSYNIATYSDILNGNTSAPDIDSGECKAMIAVNIILIVASVLAIFFFIYRLIGQALYGIWVGKGGLQGTTEGIEGGLLKTSVLNPDTEYIPNNRFTQMTLWLISTFIFITSILNILNTVKLRNGNDNNAVTPGVGFLVISIIFVIITGLFFLYTTFRSLIPKGAAYNITFKSLFESTQKPVIVTKCDCPPQVPGACNMTVKEFNTGTKLVMKGPIIPETVKSSGYV